MSLRARHDEHQSANPQPNTFTTLRRSPSLFLGKLDFVRGGRENFSDLLPSGGGMTCSIAASFDRSLDRCKRRPRLATEAAISDRLRLLLLREFGIFNP